MPIALYSFKHKEMKGIQKAVLLNIRKKPTLYSRACLEQLASFDPIE